MRGLGILLIILGIGSFILKQMDMQFRLLQWVDNWGETNGTYIKIGFIVLGVIILALSFKKRPSA